MEQKYVKKRIGNSKTGEGIFNDVLNPQWIINEASLDELRTLLAMTSGDMYKLVLKTYQEKKFRNGTKN